MQGIRHVKPGLRTRENLPRLSTMPISAWSTHVKQDMVLGLLPVRCYTPPGTHDQSSRPIASSPFEWLLSVHVPGKQRAGSAGWRYLCKQWILWAQRIQRAWRV